MAMNNTTKKWATIAFCIVANGGIFSVGVLTGRITAQGRETITMLGSVVCTDDSGRRREFRLSEVVDMRKELTFREGVVADYSAVYYTYKPGQCVSLAGVR